MSLTWLRYVLQVVFVKIIVLCHKKDDTLSYYLCFFFFRKVRRKRFTIMYYNMHARIIPCKYYNGKSSS